MKERNQSIELLRIILMTLIVFGHFLLHGIGNGVNSDGNPNFVAYITPLYRFHVDAFIFISGYYGIKLKWDKFFLLIGKMVCYSLIAVMLAMIVSPKIAPSISVFIHNIYPVSACDWWFMSSYLFLMLMSPFINKGTEHLNKKQFGILLVALYLLYFRGDSHLMLFIYMLGRYLKLYPISFLEKKALMIFIVSLASFFLFNIICMNYGGKPARWFTYMSPFNIVSAVAVFYVFNRIHISWNKIGVISSGVLAAYLITDHEILRYVFTRGVVSLVGENIILLLVLAFVCVIICSLIDILVTKLIKTVVSTKIFAE